MHIENKSDRLVVRVNGPKVHSLITTQIPHDQPKLAWEIVKKMASEAKSPFSLLHRAVGVYFNVVWQYRLDGRKPPEPKVHDLSAKKPPSRRIMNLREMTQELSGGPDSTDPVALLSTNDNFLLLKQHKQIQNYHSAMVEQDQIHGRDNLPQLTNENCRDPGVFVAHLRNALPDAQPAHSVEFTKFLGIIEKQIPKSKATRFEWCKKVITKYKNMSETDPDLFWRKVRKVGPIVSGMQRREVEVRILGPPPERPKRKAKAKAKAKNQPKAEAGNRAEAAETIPHTPARRANIVPKNVTGGVPKSPRPRLPMPKRPPSPKKRPAASQLPPTSKKARKTMQDTPETPVCHWASSDFNTEEDLETSGVAVTSVTYARAPAQTQDPRARSSWEAAPPPQDPPPQDAPTRYRDFASKIVDGKMILTPLEPTKKGPKRSPLNCAKCIVVCIRCILSVIIKFDYC